MWIAPDLYNYEKDMEMRARLEETERRSDDLGLIARMRNELEKFWRSEFGAITLVRENLRGLTRFDDYVSGNLTADTPPPYRKEWIAAVPVTLCWIVGSNITGGGTGNTVLEVWAAPASSQTYASIFTTAGNRPTRAGASSGVYTVLNPDAAAGANADGEGHIVLQPGDQFAYSVVTAATTTPAKQGIVSFGFRHV